MTSPWPIALLIVAFAFSNCFAFLPKTHCQTGIFPSNRKNVLHNHHHRHHESGKHAGLNGKRYDVFPNAKEKENNNNKNNDHSDQSFQTRRSIFYRTAQSMLMFALTATNNRKMISNAAIGTLPELADTNAVFGGITINVADQSQLDSSIKFFEDGFEFQVLRTRQTGPVSETWLGFGPEQFSIPSKFTTGVSSFSSYGGHATVHIRYDTKSTDVFYEVGSDTPGDNVAYLQLGVPMYRISQMTKNGGNILDAYGTVTVISPCGLPIRGIVGRAPDPMMFVALNCPDINESRTFYENLGFVEQEYPYARPNKGMGQFEPPQPPDSVYLAPSPNSMGILLLPMKGKRGLKRSKAVVTPNPAIQSLNIVYTPSPADDSKNDLSFMDPNGVPISFESIDRFERGISK